MSHYTEIRRIVNQDGEILDNRERRMKTQHLNGDKWSVVFFKSVEALADARPSKTAMSLFLYLLASTGMQEGELDMHAAGLAKRLDVAPTLIHKAIRDLIKMNVLMPVSTTRLPKTYRFNPRIVWYGKLQARPLDLSPYPEIGNPPEEKNNVAKTRRTRSAELDD